jgi:hypothetical protein
MYLHVIDISWFSTDMPQIDASNMGVGEMQTWSYPPGPVTSCPLGLAQLGPRRWTPADVVLLNIEKIANFVRYLFHSILHTFRLAFSLNLHGIFQVINWAHT